MEPHNAVLLLSVTNVNSDYGDPWGGWNNVGLWGWLQSYTLQIRCTKRAISDPSTDEQSGGMATPNRTESVVPDIGILVNL